MRPMRLLRVPHPFDHPNYIFEPKIDGFRALAFVHGRHCRLTSRNARVFKCWPQLAKDIARAVRASSIVLDGEVCCLEPDGRSNFRRLMFREDSPYFYAFDVLSLNGLDIRSLSLLARKRLLRSVMPNVESRLRYLDGVEECGTDLYRLACERDWEGIVAKWERGTYQTDMSRTSWLKIKNPEYSQMVDRHELFARRRPPRAPCAVAMPLSFELA
jgi:bifunctional non-homologous end joining protein LigD